MTALASIPDGSKPGTQEIHVNARNCWASVMLLAMLIVGISGSVKICPYTGPVESDSANPDTPGMILNF